jgi:hypothetical protein
MWCHPHTLYNSLTYHACPPAAPQAWTRLAFLKKRRLPGMLAPPRLELIFLTSAFYPAVQAVASLWAVGTTGSVVIGCIIAAMCAGYAGLCSFVIHCIRYQQKVRSSSHCRWAWGVADAAAPTCVIERLTDNRLLLT